MADTAKKLPAVVRATIIRLLTKNPPLVANGPEDMSIVKSTFVGVVGATSFDEQPVSVLMQAGNRSAATPKPTCDKNSFLSIMLLVICETLIYLKTDLISFCSLHLLKAD
jgi:hypothetical protein